MRTIFMVFLLDMLVLSEAQRGEFYEEGNGEVLDFTSRNVITKELGSFRYYDHPNMKSITIHRHGVVGMGDILGDCPFNDFELLSSAAFYLAPFWIPSTNGRVTFYMKKKDEFGVMESTEKCNTTEVDVIVNQTNCIDTLVNVTICNETVVNITNCNKTGTFINSTDFQHNDSSSNISNDNEGLSLNATNFNETNVITSNITGCNTTMFVNATNCNETNFVTGNITGCNSTMFVNATACNETNFVTSNITGCNTTMFVNATACNETNFVTSNITGCNNTLFVNATNCNEILVNKTKCFNETVVMKKNITTCKNETVINFTKSDLNRMVKEVNMAFINDVTHKNLSLDDINRVAFITWDRMFHKDNVPRTQVNRNSFQLVLLFLNNGNTLAFYIYRLLDYELVFNLFEAKVNAPCGSKALIGIGSNNFLYKYPISLQHFRSSRTAAAAHSNIHDHEELGRYVFKLWIPRASQPMPPTMNCIGDNPDEKSCVLINTNQRIGKLIESTSQPLPPPVTTRKPSETELPTKDSRSTSTVTFQKTSELPAVRTTQEPQVMIEYNRRISREFCLWRDAGFYQHPFFCDHFLACGVLGSRADVKRCGPGLNYNPIIGVCDYKENWECNPLENVIVKGRGYTSVAPQKVIHENKCLLRGWSNIPDPSSCDHYLACTNTRTIRMKCPAGLYFRVSGIEDGQCDYRINVRCVNGTRFGKEMISPSEV